MQSNCYTKGASSIQCLIWKLLVENWNWWRLGNEGCSDDVDRHGMRWGSLVHTTRQYKCWIMFYWHDLAHQYASQEQSILLLVIVIKSLCYSSYNYFISCCYTSNIKFALFFLLHSFYSPTLIRANKVILLGWVRIERHKLLK